VAEVQSGVCFRAKLPPLMISLIKFDSKPEALAQFANYPGTQCHSHLTSRLAGLQNFLYNIRHIVRSRLFALDVLWHLDASQHRRPQSSPFPSSRIILLAGSASCRILLFNGHFAAISSGFNIQSGISLGISLKPTDTRSH
jgi:hypothetical protein